MNTTKLDGIAFIHNGDYSGDTIIVNDDGVHTTEVRVPTVTLVGFALRVRGRNDDALASERIREEGS